MKRECFLSCTTSSQESISHCVDLDAPCMTLTLMGPKRTHLPELEKGGERDRQKGETERK